MTVNALPLGALLYNGSTKVGAVVGYFLNTAQGYTYPLGGDGLYYLDQANTTGYSLSTADIKGFKVSLQNSLQNILNNPIPDSSLQDPSGNLQYYTFITTLVSVLNGRNALNNEKLYPASSKAGENAVRLFTCMDDGTPIFDSGRCSFFGGLDASNNIISALYSTTNGGVLGNTYVNFARKLSVINSTYGLNNYSTDKTPDASGNVIIYGTAGGNAINENHHTRPEILLALFSNTGIGFAQRWSSSTRANNLYIAQRIGTNPENNQGTIRLNVPVTYKI